MFHTISSFVYINTSIRALFGIVKAITIIEDKVLLACVALHIAILRFSLSVRLFALWPVFHLEWALYGPASLKFCKNQGAIPLVPTQFCLREITCSYQFYFSKSLALISFSASLILMCTLMYFKRVAAKVEY